MTWVTNQIPITNYQDSALSLDGSISYICQASGYIYKSDNYGISWAQLSQPSRNWSSIACSSTGQVVVASIQLGSSIYVSLDYGVSWVEAWNGLGAQFWKRVCCSSTGQYLFACSINGTNTTGGIFVSSDFGATWSRTGVPGDWYQICCSYDGSFLVAGMSSVGMSSWTYTSDNCGATWQQKGEIHFTSDDWLSLACSGNGKIVIYINLQITELLSYQRILLTELMLRFL
jgi:photosystem II stability/assembly factor-like uncharacterized protein